MGINSWERPGAEKSAPAESSGALNTVQELFLFSFFLVSIE
jgi:hypothetical protein